MNIERREFLGAAALLGLPAMPRVLLEAAEHSVPANDDKVLVVVQLSGGNDALNTVIPFRDRVYHESRPTLAVPERRVLRLGAGEPTAAPLVGAPAAEDLGFHPELEGLWELYQEGALALVQGVGYPNPNRSHFRSMDIWHTADPTIDESAARQRNGWIGGALGADQRLTALDIGHREQPLALRGEREVPTLQNLDWLDELASQRGRRVRDRLRRLHGPARSGAVERVRRLAETTLDQMDHLIELRNQPIDVDYPDSGLAERLSWAGQLIAGGFPARVYYLSLGGFDTHSQQKQAHEGLLRVLSTSLTAFFRHLESRGAAKRVVTMVFSEFGRRVKENGSFGTDHGVAAPVFVLSGAAKGGVHGAHPNLRDLTGGDLKHHTDFRRVYATMLERVLGVPPAPILGGEFEALDVV